MIYLFILLLILLAAALGYLAALPADYEVRRSLAMQVDRRTVFNLVRDLRRFPDFSPWLLHEPAARLEFGPAPDQEGGWYAWDGKAVGAGRLTHAHLIEPERIEQQLSFTRPFRTRAQVRWDFAETAGGGTEVTWSMRGRLPFLLRFLTRPLARMIEQDYALGLALLRGVLDPDAERPHLSFIGPVETSPQTALTIPYRGDLPGLLAAMEDGFPRLIAHLGGLGAAPAGPLFTAYHRVDAQGRDFQCDLAVPVADGTDPGPFTSKRLGGGRCYATELAGSYSFLEPVWYSAMAHLQMHRLRRDGSRPPLEVYVRGPGEVTDTNDILTRLLIPIR